jgi:hypothetical protein
VEIEHGVLRIWDQRKRLLAKVKRGSNRLYILYLDAVQPVCLTARKDDDAWRWHERLGHVHFDALHRLGKEEMARDIPVIKHAAQVCDTCVTTKMRRRPFPQKAAYRTEQPLELVHGDLCGPITLATPGGRRYFLMVDDATRFMFVALLATKDEAAQAVKKIKAQAEKEMTANSRCCGPTMVESSPTPSSPSTSPWRESSVTSPRRIRRSRMALWNGGTKLWWPRRGLCSSSAACRLGFWGRQW